MSDTLQNHLIHITVISDNACMDAAIVMLTSAKANKLQSSNYLIHFISVNCSEYFRRKLEKLSSENFRIIIYEADISRYSKVHIDIHVTPATFLKLELPNLLSGVDKVLHIDADALVYQDLSELFSTDIGSLPLGVVKSLYLERTGYVKNKLGINTAFNAGIMLMNLNAWRAMNATEQLTSMLLNIPREWRYLEQDCMSVFFQDKLYFLPPTSNACPYVWKRFTIEEINQFYGTHYTDKNDLLDDAVILHFAGTPNIRPWQVIGGVYGSIWQYYYNMSPLKHRHLIRGLQGVGRLQKELTNSLKETKRQLCLLLNEKRIRKQYYLVCFKLFFSRLFIPGKVNRYKRNKIYLQGLLSECKFMRNEQDNIMKVKNN